MDIRIMVSTHKPYKMPEDSSLYLPIQLGADEVEERFGIQCDNMGDNISYKHRYYSDLSALYWGWKNLECDYLGSCHYRRYFVSQKKKPVAEPLFQYILDREELERLLSVKPIIVAKKRMYYIVSTESHYAQTHNHKDFQTARNIIAKMRPQYLDNFNAVASRRYAHMFNTFVMRKDLADEYCEFLFPVLFELEKRTDFTQYGVYQSRVCGYIAEFMLDTWLEKNGYPFHEVKLAMLEKPNWLVKGSVFLARTLIPGVRSIQKEG